MGGPIAWGLGKVSTTPHRKTRLRYETDTCASDLWYDLSNGKGT